MRIYRILFYKNIYYYIFKSSQDESKIFLEIVKNYKGEQTIDIFSFLTTKNEEKDIFQKKISALKNYKNNIISVLGLEAELFPPEEIIAFYSHCILDQIPKVSIHPLKYS